MIPSILELFGFEAGTPIAYLSGTIHVDIQTYLRSWVYVINFEAGTDGDAWGEIDFLPWSKLDRVVTAISVSGATIKLLDEDGQDVLRNKCASLPADPYTLRPVQPGPPGHYAPIVFNRKLRFYVHGLSSGDVGVAAFYTRI